MIAYFRARGALRFPTKWGTGLRPPRANATRQAGRGFWRIVMLKQKCRLDERSVIRQTTHSVQCVAFSRMDLGPFCPMTLRQLTLPRFHVHQALAAVVLRSNSVGDW